jgi:hypothetical protein
MFFWFWKWKDGNTKSTSPQPKETAVVSNVKTVMSALSGSSQPLLNSNSSDKKSVLLQKLIYLNLSHCPLISTEAIASLSYFKQLERLYLNGVNKVLDDAFIALSLNILKLK